MESNMENIGLNSTKRINAARRNGLSAKAVVATIVLIGACVAAVVFLGGDGGARELEAKKAIESLGGVAVFDANQQHVASLNLQLIKDQAGIQEAFQQIKHFPYLEILDASSTKVQDKDLSSISDLRHLNSLHLNRTNVGNASLKSIIALKQLKGLHLAETEVTGAAIPEIIMLQDLIHLDLSGTEIGAEVAQLDKVESLAWLLLRDIDLDEEVLTAIPKIKGLGRLTLALDTDDQTQKTNLDRLKKAMPKTNID